MKRIAKLLGIVAGILGMTFLIFGPGMSGWLLKILFWVLVLGSAIPFQKSKQKEEPIGYLFWRKKPSSLVWPPESWRGFLPEFIWRRLCLQLGWGIINQRPFPTKDFVFKEVQVSGLDTHSSNGKLFPVGGRVVLDLEVVDPHTMASAMGESVKGLEKKTLPAVREAVKTVSRSLFYDPKAGFDLNAYELELEAGVNASLAFIGLEVCPSSFQFSAATTDSKKEEKGQSAGAKFLEGLIGSLLKGVGKLVYEFLNLLRNPLDLFRGKETIEELGTKIRWRMGASAFSLLAYALLFFLWSGMWRHTWLVEKVAGPAPVAQVAQTERAAQEFQPERPSGGKVSLVQTPTPAGIYRINPGRWGVRFDGEDKIDLSGKASFRISFKEKADQEKFYNLLEVSILDSQNRVVRNRLRVGDWHQIPNEGVSLQVNFIDKADRAPALGIGFSVETR